MSAEDSIAKQIITAIVDRVTAINGGVEFHSSIGNKIVKGKPNEVVEDLPCVFVYSTEESSTDEKFPRLENTLYVSIEGHSEWGLVTDPTEAEDVAQDMITDIKKAVLSETDRTFKIESGGVNLCKRLVYLGRVIGYAADGSRVVASRCNFMVEYRERAGSPHVQG